MSKHTCTNIIYSAGCLECIKELETKAINEMLEVRDKNIMLNRAYKFEIDSMVTSPIFETYDAAMYLLVEGLTSWLSKLEPGEGLKVMDKDTGKCYIIQEVKE